MSVSEVQDMEMKEDRFYPNMSRKINFKDTAKYRGANDLTYREGVLLGNWREERNGVERLCLGEKLPGLASHNYNTTYQQAFNSTQVMHVPPGLKNFVSFPSHRKFIAYPGHQPELGPCVVPSNQWISVYKNDFIPRNIDCKECQDKK